MKATAEELLSIHNITTTPIRLLVLQTLLKYNKAFSLKDLETILFYAERSSIFRTLQLFEQNGILHKIITSDSIIVYALCDTCTKEKHTDKHAHFKCKQCEHIYCIPISLDTIEFYDTNFIIDDVQIFTHGICSNCNSVA